MSANQFIDFILNRIQDKIGFIADGKAAELNYARRNRFRIQPVAADRIQNRDIAAGKVGVKVIQELAVVIEIDPGIGGDRFRGGQVRDIFIGQESDRTALRIEVIRNRTGNFRIGPLIDIDGIVFRCGVEVGAGQLQRRTQRGIKRKLDLLDYRLQTVVRNRIFQLQGVFVGLARFDFDVGFRPDQALRSHSQGGQGRLRIRYRQIHIAEQPRHRVVADAAFRINLYHILRSNSHPVSQGGGGCYGHPHGSHRSACNNIGVFERHAWVRRRGGRGAQAVGMDHHFVNQFPTIDEGTVAGEGFTGPEEP
ncbi:MAG: hypothetical protein BWY71_01778 [Planctomycetes bacterium ADurb.Bin412]|nr:MAG: hypothetical protein BWY71_01778 [Planctomycetes bacterium ADurb.Bin412]